MGVVLSVIAETVRCLGILIQPVMPQSADKLLSQLKVPDDKRQFMHLSAEFALEEGTTIDKPEGVFPRITENEEAA